ncbi:MAG: hypothetical protein KJ069_14120 [Anaerolineae bacterium]|nr:hypothetical protein [Anaerolineae bacterium]
MDKFLRVLTIGSGIGLLVLVAGYFWQWPWAVATWPWPDGPLSYTFIAGIQAAIAAALLWIGLTGEWGALANGALNLVVMMAGLAVFFFARGLPLYAIGCAVFVLFNAGLFWWSHRLPLRDTRPTPRLVRGSFVVFTATLLLVGSALVLRVPIIFPWPLNPDSSVIFGLIFIGDAFYFLYAVLRPQWHYAAAPLWSFLAYDVVLLARFIPHFGNVRPEHQGSLYLYTAVLIYSAALAIYYLFIQRETRPLLVAAGGVS